ncbi:MAG: fumarylacetoacetate hydrolase family protein [Bauldia litoralis]
MKLLRVGVPGRERPAILDGQGRARDLSDHVPDIAGAALLPESLGRLAEVDVDGLPVLDGAERIAPCVGAVGKLVGIGLNYADHAAEANVDLPSEPIIFLKATSALSGPFDDVVLPAGSTMTDWEVELGVVIGTPGKDIEEDRALDHIAGYAVVNDYSERDYQLRTAGRWTPMARQWTKGKSCDTFAPLGPWLVTADEIADPQALDLWLTVDGRRYQNSSTAKMVFGVAHLVSYVSRFMSLQSGDVIATGTPAGVGMGQSPEVYLRRGQTVRAGITGVGEMEQRVA